MLKRKYNAIYQDKYGVISGMITNTFTEKNSHDNYLLELKLNNTFFKGDTFDGLELQEQNNQEKELERFSFNKTQIFHSNNFVKELTDCMITFDVSLNLINTQSLASESIDGTIIISLGRFSPIDNSIIKIKTIINNSNIEVTGDSFEKLLDNLKNKIKDSYLLKNCYGCKYSDYSPYGRASFGDMMCFKHLKEKYSKVHDKLGLFEVMANNEIIQVLETYLCNQYLPRKENTGYRG
ncbi:conserved protein of unknown function [Tenacibaculum sp. 190130A14a]|uniref:Uncharacterized protein n=1 Tax=Tenacibaculum polynesiense TaxID=3137857 RepID=A0ABM9PG42_9FLAO